MCVHAHVCTSVHTSESNNSWHLVLSFYLVGLRTKSRSSDSAALPAEPSRWSSTSTFYCMTYFFPLEAGIYTQSEGFGVTLLCSSINVWPWEGCLDSNFSKTELLRKRMQGAQPSVMLNEQLTLAVATVSLAKTFLKLWRKVPIFCRTSHVSGCCDSPSSTHLSRIPTLTPRNCPTLTLARRQQLPRNQKGDPAPTPLLSGSPVPQPRCPLMPFPVP